MTRSLALPIACCIAMLALAYVAAPVFAQDAVLTTDQPASIGGFAESTDFRVNLCVMQSEFGMSLFTGEYSSALTGTLDFRFDSSIKMKLSDNEVPVVMTAADLRCVVPFKYSPRAKVSTLMLNPKFPAIGAFNVETGEMWISAYFTTPRGNLPVPMPVTLVGSFADGYLNLAIASDMIDAGVDLRLAGAIDTSTWAFSRDAAGNDVGTLAIPEDERPVCRPFIEVGGD